MIAAAARDGTRRSARDILSLLLAARDEDGHAMTDQELRDELLTLVLAGHETTANSLAWTFERLLRTPRAYDRLREAVRGDGEEPPPTSRRRSTRRCATARSCRSPAAA